jgi:multiple sugar transport system permease protein
VTTQDTRPISAPAPAHSGSYQRGKTLRRLGSYLLLIVFAIFFAFPIVFMLVTSFKTDPTQVTRDVSSLNAFVPYGQLGLDNYAAVLQRIDFVRYLLNTLLIVGVVLTVGTLVNSMLAFALARLRWKGRNLVLTGVVLLLIIPNTALTVPNLQLLNWFDWFNSYQGIIVPNLVNPLYIFLFYQFFIGLPKDFDEAAIVDGAGYWRIYWSVILPLSRPVIATVTILSFLAGWAMYLWPLLVSQDPNYWPIMVGLGYFLGLQPAVPAQVMAYIAMVTIPVLVVFAFFQKWFIQSVASAGVKG